MIIKGADGLEPFGSEAAAAGAGYRPIVAITGAAGETGLDFGLLRLGLGDRFSEASSRGGVHRVGRWCEAS